MIEMMVLALAVLSLGTVIFLPVKNPSDPRFLARVRAEIEATLSPRPTDSILQRHHDALVSAKLQSRLAEVLK